MSTSIKYIKNQVQSCSNVKRIHNYSYYTDRIIGSGNFSTVYEAFSHTTHNKIAAKVVKMSSLTFKKLEQLLDQEIQILLTLNHKNTIRCFDVLKTQQQCYIFTQYCDKGTLDQILKQKGPMNEQQAWPYIKGLFEGLKYLNSKNIIHRDLKPANIFLKEDTVKIADFGFAIHARENFTDMNIGSPFYMSPEAFLNNIYGSKTDIWSFGIILYELLHGKTPFYECNDGEALKQRIVIQIKPQNFKQNISRELRDLIIRCLSIDELKRISISEIQQTLFMKKKNSVIHNSQIKPYQFKIQHEGQKLQHHRYGNHKIIKIASKLLIKEKIEENGAKQNYQPKTKYYYDILKSKSDSKNSISENTASTLTETNPESPYLPYYRPTIYKTSSYRPKEEFKAISYESFLNQGNKGAKINAFNNFK